jgi:hypothetical protein
MFRITCQEPSNILNIRLVVGHVDAAGIDNAVIHAGIALALVPARELAQMHIVRKPIAVTSHPLSTLPATLLNIQRQARYAKTERCADTQRA